PLVVLVVIYYSLWNNAEVARQKEKDQATIARSHELSAVATNVLNADPDRGVVLAREAVRICSEEVPSSPSQIEAQQRAHVALNLALQARRVVLRLEGHEGRVNSVAFSADGTLLATGGADKTAKIWDTSRGRKRFDLEGHAGEVQSVAFSSDGKRLAT